MVSAKYRRREPEKSPFYGFVLDHWNEFLQTADTRSGNERRLPRFVLNTVEAFLKCGIPACGHIRVRCRSCGYEGAIPFSCKQRGFCPSCGGKRMAEIAAHLTDRVIPHVPIRQWVLTTPWDVRFILAKDAKLLGEAERIYIAEMFRHYRKQARKKGGPGEVIPGAVTAVQRMGSSLNLNIHFHTIFLDGVYRPDPKTGEIRFQKAPLPTATEMDHMLQRTRERIQKMLEKHGHHVDPDAPPQWDASDEEESLFEHIQSASVRGWSSMEGKDRPVVMVGGGNRPKGPQELKVFNSVYRGWSLNAMVRIRAGDREGVERVCRYILRHPFAEERLEFLPDGNIRFTFRDPRPDGATHAIFRPIEFMEKLVALIPPPRYHTVRYHGIFAPNHPWREAVVPAVRPRPGVQAGGNAGAVLAIIANQVEGGPVKALEGNAGSPDQNPSRVGAVRDCPAEAERRREPPLQPVKMFPIPQSHRSEWRADENEFANTPASPQSVWNEHPRGWKQGRPRLDWAQLLKRSLHLDGLECPRCGEKMTMVAVIKDPDVARKILKAMGLPSEIPVAARPPPRGDAVELSQDSESIFPPYDDSQEVA